MSQINKIVAILILSTLFIVSSAEYKPTWDSLDSRPLPGWYDDAKLGIFIHWGVFSVPAYGCDAAGEWYWWILDQERKFQNISLPTCTADWHDKSYGKDFQYQDFANQFKTVAFDADQWAQLFKKSGAKYVVLTSKHHDGFCNWPSAQSWNWNSKDVGPHQDNVKLVSDAVKKTGLKMGLYHSLFEWFHPLYLSDKHNGSTTEYVDQILLPQLYDIVNSYQPEILWADGAWEQPDNYWKSREFLAWLYNDSPVKSSVVVNDRWGNNIDCKHGDFYTCQDNYNPGSLQTHKWENCFTIDKASWGFRRNANIEDYLSAKDIIKEIVTTVSCGGNVLLNVGPRADGGIDAVYQERLLQIGDWMEINGEAIYSTNPWAFQNDSSSQTIWYTQKRTTIYGLILSFPISNFLLFTKITPTADTKITMLGLPYQKLTYVNMGAGGIQIDLSQIRTQDLPSQDAWVLKMENVLPKGIQSMRDRQRTIDSVKKNNRGQLFMH